EREKKKRQINITKAQLELEKILLEKKLKTQLFEIRIERIRKKLKRKESRLKKLKEKIKRGRVLAPHKGSILYVKRWTQSGLGNIKEGDMAREGMSFVKVGGLENYRIHGTVKEEHKQWLKVGQEVEFFLGTGGKKAKKFKGHLHSIAEQAEAKESNRDFPWIKDQALIPTDARVFKVKIDILSHSKTFQPGKSGNFTIFAESFKNCALVPRNFVGIKGKDYYIKSTTRGIVPVQLLGGKEHNYIIQYEGNEPLSIEQP
ncbi:hypothetical protein ACFL35_13785, partial [Candidatus Riflebacteria bacterium]